MKKGINGTTSISLACTLLFVARFDIAIDANLRHNTTLKWDQTSAELACVLNEINARMAFKWNLSADHAFAPSVWTEYRVCRGWYRYCLESRDSFCFCIINIINAITKTLFWNLKAFSKRSLSTLKVE
jgi:hypothetical protein